MAASSVGDVFFCVQQRARRPVILFDCASSSAAVVQRLYEIGTSTDVKLCSKLTTLENRPWRSIIKQEGAQVFACNVMRCIDAFRGLTLCGGNCLEPHLFPSLPTVIHDTIDFFNAFLMQSVAGLRCQLRARSESASAALRNAEGSNGDLAVALGPQPQALFLLQGLEGPVVRMCFGRRGSASVVAYGMHNVNAQRGIRPYRAFPVCPRRTNVCLTLRTFPCRRSTRAPTRRGSGRRESSFRDTPSSFHTLPRAR